MISYFDIKAPFCFGSIGLLQNMWSELLTKAKKQQQKNKKLIKVNKNKKTDNVGKSELDP